MLPSWRASAVMCMGDHAELLPSPGLILYIMVVRLLKLWLWLALGFSAVLAYQPPLLLPSIPPPSPVDVYHLAERIETVDHEGMACSHILSAVQYGTACADFVLHNMVEFGLSCCFGTLL